MKKPSQKSSTSSAQGPWLDDDLVVWRIRKNQNCAMCKRPLKKQRHDLASMEKSSNRWFATCVQCLHIDNLVFLPAGDSRVTRMASRLSSRRAVVMTTRHKAQRREGILVELSALREACEKYDIQIPPELQESAATDPSEATLQSEALTTPETPRPTPQRASRRETTRNYRFYETPSPKAAEKPRKETPEKPSAPTKPVKSTEKTYTQVLAERIRARYPRSPDQMVEDIAHYAAQVYLPQHYPNEPRPSATDVDLGPLLTAFLRR